MATLDSTAYDFNHWYVFAQAERTKLVVWSVDVGAIYVVRFLVQNWISDDSLPRTAAMWNLKDIGAAFTFDIPDYNVKGITLMHIAPGQQMYIMQAGQMASMSQVTADAGTWVVDVVFTATKDSHVTWASNSSWIAYVAQKLGALGHGQPNVSLMGLVTIHCGPNASICTLMGVDDPDPGLTQEVSSYWQGMPDLLRCTIDDKKVPHVALLDAYRDSQVKLCVGLGGSQLAIGFHDHVGLSGTLIPVFRCTDGSSGLIDPTNVVPGPDPTNSDLPPPDALVSPQTGVAGLAKLTTNQKLVLGAFALGGFLLGAKWFRMRA